MRNVSTLVFDDARSARCKVFDTPIDVIRAESGSEVGPAMRRMEDRLHAGFHLAGYFSYELGYVLESRLAGRLPAQRQVPLLWFGVFARAPRELDSTELDREWTEHRGYAGPLRVEWSDADYAAKFAHVAERIRRGDIYQANLSMRGGFSFVGDARGLYLALRKQAGASFGAYVDDGARRILSFSPELFFELDPDGRIKCRPMKGTAPRGADACMDESMRESLRTSLKNRAENLMIVDLVRNDVGRIAEIGSVRADDLFSIETYPTVHQLVSGVSAKVKRGTSVEQLLRAMFPCGSVTGAPKIRSMEVIHDLESGPRGVYCGSIGYFSPDGSACFNVAIRTLTIAGGCGQLGVGGGVVSDSVAAGEYAECLLKARYFEAARRPIRLIETLRYEASGYVRLALHLQRLEASARVFGLPCERERVLAALKTAGHGAVPLRVRLTLDEQGAVEVTSEPCQAATHWRYVLSAGRVASTDTLLRHKTDWRDLYDSERQQAAEAGCDEVIFLNERDELCEGSRSNLFLSSGGVLVTPASSSGLLDGCLRRELLAAGRCREAVLTVADLATAEEVYFGNSLHGLVPAVPVPGRVAAASGPRRPSPTKVGR